MIRGILPFVALILVALLDPGPAAAQRVMPPDFKLLVDGFSLEKDPILREEIVSRDGLIYHFSFNNKEVIVFDASRRKVEIIDLGRRIRTEVSYAQLDEGLARVRTGLKAAIDDRKAKGGRGNRIEAEMTGHLLDPSFQVSHDPKAGKLRLTNPSVEVEATGEADPDAARLALIRQTLEHVAKLGAFRTPNDLPPFVELDTLSTLMGPEVKLRPTEISYLYRLNGPPQKFRRTYKLVAELTDRDREAISRIDRVRQTLPAVRYEKFRNP